MCNGEQNETFEQWEARMDASGAKAPKGGHVDWVIDGHGHWVDPAKDVMDDVAKRRVAARQNS